MVHNINWNIFTSELDKAKDQLEIKQRGSFSQIVEQVIELSRTPGLNFDTSNKYRKPTLKLRSTEILLLIKIKIK